MMCVSTASQMFISLLLDLCGSTHNWQRQSENTIKLLADGWTSDALKQEKQQLMTQEI